MLRERVYLMETSHQKQKITISKESRKLGLPVLLLLFFRSIPGGYEKEDFPSSGEKACASLVKKKKRSQE